MTFFPIATNFNFNNLFFIKKQTFKQKTPLWILLGVFHVSYESTNHTFDAFSAQN